MSWTDVNRMPNTRRIYRIFFASVVIGSIVLLVTSNVLVPSAGENRRDIAKTNGTIAPPDEDITIVVSEGGGFILAVDSDGERLYYNDSHYFYYDVDPSPEGSTTVIYSAVETLDVDYTLCDPVRTIPDQFYNGCTRQIIERANLTTGEVTELYSRIYPRRRNSEWHDVDRINDTRVIVADMYNDEVFIVNTESGIVEWEWNAQDYLQLSSGGQFPNDWTHLNDVEVLENGWIMASLRNQDQVVFINRSTGVVENWTLGKDDQHDILYEQHNPDFIPAEDGGPAVVVSDSENDRIVEYQFRSGVWTRTWSWQDNTLQWPRDADRLPNGHTLVTDTQGGRVLEINEEGEIVWTMQVAGAYEAERLKSGPESSDGPSAVQAELVSKGIAESTKGESASDQTSIDWLRGLIPNKTKHGIRNVLDALGLWWVGFLDILLFGVFMGSSLTWGIFEFRWSNYQLRWPVSRSK